MHTRGVHFFPCEACISPPGAGRRLHGRAAFHCRPWRPAHRRGAFPESVHRYPRSRARGPVPARPAVRLSACPHCGKCGAENTLCPRHTGCQCHAVCVLFCFFFCVFAEQKQWKGYCHGYGYSAVRQEQARDGHALRGHAQARLAGDGSGRPGAPPAVRRFWERPGREGLAAGTGVVWGLVSGVCGNRVLTGCGAGSGFLEGVR